MKFEMSETSLVTRLTEKDVGNLMVGPYIVDCCDNCKSLFKVNYPYMGGTLMIDVMPNYCPACGAKVIKQ